MNNKKKLLRVLFSSNAPFSVSGYGQQMADLLPRLVKAGYPTAVNCFFGLEGGSINLEGIKCYPKMADKWGTDGMINHAKHFKADVVISLQDIWVLDPNALRQVKNWIPICVDGNTLVTIEDGSQIKIKDIVKNKMNVKVLGYDGKKIVETEIKGWQKIPDKMDVYEIKTRSSKVLITGNNEVWVKSIIDKGSSIVNKPDWKRTDSIIAGDMVYLAYNEPSNKESNNKKHKTFSNRFSLSSWTNRCRRNNNNNESDEKESKNWNQAHNSSINSSNKHRRENDKMGSGKDWCEDEQSLEKQGKFIQSEFRKISKIGKNLLHSFNMGLQLPTNTKTNNSLLNNKEGKRAISNEVYSIKNQATENKIQSTIYKRGDRYLGESKDIKPEVVLAIRKVKAPKRTVYDISTKTGNFFANKILVHNCPIDHDPVPPAIHQRLKLAHRIITYAPFGQRELKRVGMHSTYIPHTVDTDLFKPLDKKAIRKKIGIPEDIFLFGMVAANKDNPPRKSFQEVMDAFVKFKKNHPKSGIYFHTLLRQGGGFNIDEYAKVLGIQDSIYHVQPYEQLFAIGKDQMPDIYSAMDCLLIPSTNEGFGVPIIEAQSCGVPVITNNFTAMPDLIKEGKTGFLCEVAHKRFTPLGSYIGHPSTESIYKNMEKMFKADRVSMGKTARKFMIKEFDSKKVLETKWLPFLEMLEKEIYPEQIDLKEKID